MTLGPQSSPRLNGNFAKTHNFDKNAYFDDLPDF